MRGVTVLENWQQIGEAVYFLSNCGYRYHKNPIKNWDLMQISKLFADLGRDELVIDLGASTLGGLRLCHEMGFHRLIGYDLEFTVFDRLLQVRDWLGDASQRHGIAAVPYKLRTGDLLKTKLPAQSVGGIICLSVVEHGVDLARFFDEVARLLKPNGRLYVSTDYWDPRLDTGGRKMYGLPWTVFSGQELSALIRTAEQSGLTPYPWNADDLRCDDSVVHDGPHAYTFAAMNFLKKAA